MSVRDDTRERTVLREERVDASAPPGEDRTRTRVGASQVLFGLALLLAWSVLYLVVLSGLEQGHAQGSLYERLRSDLAEGTAPTGAPIVPGTPVAVLSIPGIDVSGLVVVEGTRSTQLQDGPGHLLGSVLPGQQGVSSIAGRSVSFGAPFRRITELTPGALIKVTTAQGVFDYDVLGVRAKGDPVPAPVAAGASRLTLVTSAAGSTGLGLASSGTVYVDALLAEGAVAAGPVATPDPDARLMAAGADTTTLALLALCLQLLAAVLAAFVWAWFRWSRAAAWIAVAPCVLASLWLASSFGSRLLPGLA